MKGVTKDHRCSSNAVMKFPQLGPDSKPVYTCNYHKNKIVEHNPQDPHTGLYRIDASTPIKLYVNKEVTAK
jgi:hypothetical protein